MDDEATHAEHPRAEPGSSRLPDTRYEALLESAPDAIVIIDERGRIQIVNSEAEKMFGYARGELVGHEVEMLVPDRLKQIHVENRCRYTANPKRRPMGIGLDLSARRSDGKEFPVEISLSPARTDDELLIIAVIRDVTSRRRLEQAARNARAISAQEHERLRIARDLHDEIAQALSGIAFGLRQIESAARLETARERARRLGEEAAGAMRELRRVAEHLRPDELADLGLADSLERMADGRQKLNPKPKIVFHGRASDPRLEPEAELAVYRVVQEALTNAIKHAEANRIEIDLMESNSSIVATVRDDGCGFDVDACVEKGLGLSGMRERARLLGGDLKIDSAAGRGTEVALRLPLEPA